MAIARALINDPALILADEPTANLDSKIGHEAMRLLRRIAKEQGRSVIIVSHDARIKDMVSRVDYGIGRGPLKDTVLVDPKERLAIEWVADNPGDWAFHCHQVYHAERGVMRVIKVA